MGAVKVLDICEFPHVKYLGQPPGPHKVSLKNYHSCPPVPSGYVLCSIVHPAPSAPHRFFLICLLPLQGRKGKAVTRAGIPNSKKGTYVQQQGN